MPQPILFILDDDAQVLKAISRDLRKQYRKDYRILSTASASEALDALKTLRTQGEQVALFLSDQRMPEMLGVEFLTQARRMFGEAKRVLLTAYSDTDAAIRAINEAGLDYYLLKPWDPPKEKLYPILDELLDDWLMSNRPDNAGLRVVGFQYSPQSHEIKDFLAGNLMPYKWMDIESSPLGEELLLLNNIDKGQLPAVFFEDGSFLLKPKPADIATKLGRNMQPDAELYDVVVVGAGPAGLAAGVYGASEGLKTLVLDKRAPGGQAGTSSRIENYLGFPTGLSGAELSRRALTQAQRLGAELITPSEVVGMATEDGYKVLTLADGQTLRTQAVVLTMGVDYRKLPAEGIDAFSGAGVYYGAASTEASACQNQDIFIVGGGNSAGQAAMYLSRFARRVYIVIRRPDLMSSMSHYLIEQLNGQQNVQLLPETEVIKASGNGKLEHLCLKNSTTGDVTEYEAAGLFIFIGTRPHTSWLPQAVLRTEKGHVLTGRELMAHQQFSGLWPVQREPFLLETSVPGVFAAGDVRAGAMNRVASAVGEGAMAIKLVHEYLA